MHAGYIKLFRRSLNKGWLQNPPLWTFWCWCLLQATHKPVTVIMAGQRIALKPGQFVFTLRGASKELKMGVRQIRTALAFLTKAGNLTRKTTHHYSIATVVNWHTYQVGGNESDTASNTQPTHNRHSISSKPTPDKGQRGTQECKNEKNKYICQVHEVFSYWQQVMGHSRAKLSNDRRQKITERLKEGYTVEDIKKAINGCKATPHNMGNNESNTVYDDIELICRKGSKLEHFMHNAERKPSHTFLT